MSVNEIFVGDSKCPAIIAEVVLSAFRARHCKYVPDRSDDDPLVEQYGDQIGGRKTKNLRESGKPRENALKTSCPPPIACPN